MLGALSVPLGLCGVSVRDVHPHLNGAGAPAGPRVPLNATPSRPRLSRGLDRRGGRRPGCSWPSKMCWMLGALENQRLTSSQQHCPGPGHPEVVVTAKPSAMETIVQPQEQEAGQPPSARCLAAFPSRALVMLLCLARPRFGLRSAAFAGRPASSLPLSMPRGRHSWHTRPLFRLLPSSSLCLLKIVSSGAQLVESGRRQGTPGNGHRAGPGFLCQPRSVCIPGPARVLPARPVGPPFCCGSRRFWERKTETSPVFSRLPGF